MPAPTTVTTPAAMHQQMVQTIQSQLAQSKSTATHQAMPVTSDTHLNIAGTHPAVPEIDENPLIEYYERAILGKPGHEPSKTFLHKLIERVKRKHPNAEVRLK